MLMQVQSGLTRLEVKQKQVLQHGGRIQAPAFALRPLVLLGLGLGLLLAALAHGLIGLALAGLIAGLAGLGHLGLTRWLAALDAPRQVLVVRDGLVRPIAASDLVVGDVVQVQAGTRLTVDVSGAISAQPALWLRLLLTITAQPVAFGVAPAGSRAVASAQARVLAVGADRLVARLVQGDAAAGQLATLSGWLLAAALAFGCAIRAALGGLAVLPQALMARQAALLTRRPQPARLAAFGREITLVGTTRHDAQEAAFRYNQDPVSWRFA
ncbi:hypothetical protein [Lacticaseibacillus parakribbianus]|uniref:hypothetical protein n=1 Tax=Lacticaseibacillus parakribbianus TaxID=2970927 RepID=UPI0021CB99FB|nr:hypothetical protein [Lacticaseibacillus parakribbianus]